MTTPFDRANRTYYVSDERLRAFRALTPEEKLQWVEELASFCVWRSLSVPLQRRKAYLSLMRLWI